MCTAVVGEASEGKSKVVDDAEHKGVYRDAEDKGGYGDQSYG
jgi:hypothetical protein